MAISSSDENKMIDENENNDRMNKTIDWWECLIDYQLFIDCQSTQGTLTRMLVDGSKHLIGVYDWLAEIIGYLLMPINC